ncbi:MAG TPA: ribonuclease E/G [Mobilitalea sp.]|nr:ribonuclease E/G [Mobilitalea sp.]
MEQKLVITKQDNKIISTFIEGRDMVQVSLNSSKSEDILGNIYLGKVKNIIKNINAAFIEIADGRMCYYSMSENRYPIIANLPETKLLEDNPSGRLTETVIKVGDELIVQVSKEDVKTKAPVVTSNINLTGRYIALTYGKTTLGVSAKIEDEKERKRLRNIVKRFESNNHGFVIRTNAAYVQEDVIINELMKLQSAFENIRSYGIHKNRFSLLYRTPPNYICDIRDGYVNHVDEFITDDALLYEHIKEYLEHFQVEDIGKLRLYSDATLSLSNLYGINEKLKEALKPMVWLKSGGTLVIQPTEALTAIDVNTGKAVGGKKKVQETFLKVNREAAKEIAKQIRLRNLSGIIIIDFIDLELSKDKELLMEELESFLKADPIKTTLVDMTALGLVEVTRKKVRKPLHEQILD